MESLRRSEGCTAKLVQRYNDATAGGCRDGLHPDRLSENQGAESTLAFLLARAEMQVL